MENTKVTYSLNDIEKLNGLMRQGIELVDKFRKDIHAAYRTNDKTNAPKDVMDSLYDIEGLLRTARRMGSALYTRLYNS